MIDKFMKWLGYVPKPKVDILNNLIERGFEIEELMISAYTSEEVIKEHLISVKHNAVQKTTKVLIDHFKWNIHTLTDSNGVRNKYITGVLTIVKPK